MTVTLQGALQDWTLLVPLVRLPAETRQMSYLHTYMARLGGSILGLSACEHRSNPQCPSYSHRNALSRLWWSKLIFVQCRVPSEKFPSPFSPNPSFSSRYTSSLSSFEMLFNTPQPTCGFLPEFLLFLVLLHIFLIFYLLAKPPVTGNPALAEWARLN